MVVSGRGWPDFRGYTCFSPRGLEHAVIRASCGFDFKGFSIAQASPPRKYIHFLFRGRGKKKEITVMSNNFFAT